MDLPALEPFCHRLLEYLEAEAASQRTCLGLTQRLTAALVACDHPQIAAATADLGAWEQDHRPLLDTAEALALEWGTLEAGGAPFTVSAVLRRVERSTEAWDYRWRIAALAGEIKEMVTANASQAELNRLLISQHADVLHQTYVAIAQAVIADRGAGGYDIQGAMAAAPITAALLDARG